MKIAITGGTGFVGRHLAKALVRDGHRVVLVARGIDQRDQDVRHLQGVEFVPAAVDDGDALARAFAGCEAVAHCAGINRELPDATFQSTHVRGTAVTVNAARTAGVARLALLSFVGARPSCGSPYHESKWQAEEIVRRSGLAYTVIKAGMIYGRGDHMLDHTTHAVCTLPLFATVGLREKPIRPVAIDDVLKVLHVCLIEGRLSSQTVAVLGPEEMRLSDAVRRVAVVLQRRVLVVPAPVAFHRLLARLCEHLMVIPLIARAQVRMLADGISEPATPCMALPNDLLPARCLDERQIRQGIPPPVPFGWHDVRCRRVRRAVTA